MRKTVCRGIFGLAVLVTIAGFLGCASAPKTSVKSVERVDPGQVVDLSGRWNDSDAQMVAEHMVKDCLSRPWLTNWTAMYPGRLPMVVVGEIRNMSLSHNANADPFITAIEGELINSGRVGFVADPGLRQEIINEINWQQKEASAETKKSRGQAWGADYYLTGTINEIPDASGSMEIVFYQVDLELIELETQRKVWIGTKKIKKVVEHRKSRF